MRDLALPRHLKMVRFNERKPFRHSRTFNAEATSQEEMSHDIPALYNFRVTAEIGFTQLDIAENEYRVQDLAVKFIMREVYGPVYDELIEVIKELREMGISSQHEPMRRITNIMQKLEGDTQ